MNGIHFRQPYVAIYAGTFVKPTVAEAGVHSQDNVVPAAVIQKIGEIEAEWCVAIVVTPDEAPVHEHKHIAKSTVELDPDAAAQVARRNFKLAPVPAHAVFGIPTAQRLIAVGAQLIVPDTRVIANEWLFHGPVVRKVQHAPLGIIEAGLRKLEIASLGKVTL